MLFVDYLNCIRYNRSRKQVRSDILSYNVVDVFAGVGGLSYGFAQSPDFNIVLANEWIPDIAKAYSLNHPNVEMLNMDICDLTEELLKEKLKGKTIDIVVGGPPCQSYSTAGKREMDGRANLFMEYKRILTVLNPKIFIFENVVGMLSMDGGKLFKKIQSEFESIGYNLKYKVLNAADYGVPQLRERVILVGCKGENKFEYPTPTHGENLLPYVTLEDAIGDLPELKSGEMSDKYKKGIENNFLSFVRKNSVVLTEHKAPKNGEHLIKIMEYLKDGEGKDSLPEELRPKKGFGNSYAKLWWKKPATTITRNFACPSSSRCIHPRDSRALTIREGARLQSFPDTYKFYGSDGMKRLEIGNAVPPLLSIALSKSVLIYLRGFE